MRGVDAVSCNDRRQKLGKVLYEADEQWRALETRLGRAEEEVLQTHFETFRGWCGLQDSELKNWAEGGLRSKVRGRVHRYILAPLIENMRRLVKLNGLPAAAEGQARETAHVLDILLDRWESEVEPLADEAGFADQRLAKRARRKEKLGSMRDAQDIETRERPATWAPLKGALEALAEPVTIVAALIEKEASLEAVWTLEAHVPSVVARAVCDWHFGQYAVEFEQLENWWDGAKSALERQPALWERLLEEEGVFVRRTDRGVDRLRAAKHQYQSFADFGTDDVSSGIVPSGEWPSKAVSMLVNAISEFRNRLRPIRDSAAWRVVDAAKGIQREFRGGKKASQWGLVRKQDGAAALCKALDLSLGSPCVPMVGGDVDPFDSTLVFMRRIHDLVAVLGDLRESFHAEAASGAGGPGDMLEDMLFSATNLSEELLGVMDDPTPDGVESWVQRWNQFGEDIGGTQRLESSMAIVEQAAASPARKQRLLLLRGVQALLDDVEFRALMVSKPVCSDQRLSLCVATDLSPMQHDGSAEQFSEPPTSTVAAPESPRGGYVARQIRPPRLAESNDMCEQNATGDCAVAGEEPVLAAAPSPANVPTSASAETAPELAQLNESPVASRPETASSTWTRPVTPSWLQPPWPRAATLSADPWTRPDTPSTVCDDAEVTPMPRWKFVNGEYVSLKPKNSPTRLPPLQFRARAN